MIIFCVKYKWQRPYERSTYVFCSMVASISDTPLAKRKKKEKLKKKKKKNAVLFSSCRPRLSNTTQQQQHLRKWMITPACPM